MDQNCLSNFTKAGFNDQEIIETGLFLSDL
jgi:hypothetical protein